MPRLSETQGSDDPRRAMHCALFIPAEERKSASHDKGNVPILWPAACAELRDAVNPDRARSV